MTDEKPWSNIVGQKLQPMPQVFYCAGLVRDFTKRTKEAHNANDFPEAQKWAVALEDANKSLYEAIKALPTEEREMLVAMYETLRHWAYR